jgi:hypothetical protein
MRATTCYTREEDSVRIARPPDIRASLDTFFFRCEILLGSVRLLAVTSAALILSTSGSAGAQTPSAVKDSYELVTGPTEILVTPEQRQSAVDLLENVQHNFNESMSGFPYSLKVSFNGSGDTEYEGDGTMESDEAHPNWRWTARVGGLTPTRMMVHGKIYGTAGPVPLRVQMVRGALFRPIPGSPGRKAIRVADVEFNGEQVRCVLLAGIGPPAGMPRQWSDREYCADPRTGLLKISSEAAGVYAIYDYTNAVDFHGHTLPRQITFFQGEKAVLDIHVDSMSDGVEDAEALFSSTAANALVEPTFLLASAQWTPIHVDEDPQQGSLVRIEPVMVHATASNDTGKVMEAEAIGHSDLSERAVEVVRQTAFSPTGFQRDLYVAVEFYVRQ